MRSTAVSVIPNKELDMFAIHDDLNDGKGGYTIHRFCTPIFIADEFELLLGDPTARDESKNTAKTRNGTLTIVSIKGNIYGITCRHVIEELERRQAKKREEYKEKYGFEPPEETLAKIYVTKDNLHIHINHRFHKHIGDPFTGEQRDIAIAKLSPSLLNRLEKFALPASKATHPESLDIEGLCGIATGSPEANRRVSSQNELLNNLHISTVFVLAELANLDEKRVRLFGELSEQPSADNLSGMSGGPIIWSHENDWGFAGIIYNGRDIVGNEQSNNESAFTSPTVWIDGEAINSTFLEELAELIPSDEKPLKDGSKMLYIPDSLQKKEV